MNIPHTLAQLSIGQTAVPAPPLPPAPTPAEIAMIVVGLGVFGAGIWLMGRARRTEPGAPCSPALPLVGAVRRSTMLTLAVCVLVVGYHIAAWMVPLWMPLHIPSDRWWMLAIGLVLMAGGSLLAERLERE